jgi:hypothetical protein
MPPAAPWPTRRLSPLHALIDHFTHDITDRLTSYRPSRASPRATKRRSIRYPNRKDQPPTQRVQHTITLHKQT